MTYFFETYGCQMNKAESAAIEQMLLSRGWASAPSAESADLAVINTCSVRATAETRVYGRLGWYAGLKSAWAEDASLRGLPSRPVLAVTGCMAERLLADFKKRFPVIDYVVGNFQKSRFGEIAQSLEDAAQTNAVPAPVDLDAEPGAHGAAYSFSPVSLEPGAFTAFVPIMHGCDNFCSYCIVPFVRGREVSRPPAEILSELDQLSAAQVREITLLGQNVNSYCWQGDRALESVRFPGLMRRIVNHLEAGDSPIRWVRFMSSHPKDLSDELIEVIAEERRLCRHIHLPCQHGSTKILAAMNRKYSREQYLDRVRKIRERLPDASLSTDILLGFPGETGEDFDQTLSLLRQVRFEAAFMYYFNPREGTPAASMPGQIPLEVRKARLQEVIDLQLAITREEMAKRLGGEAVVLAQSVSRDNPGELLGITEQNERAVFAAPQSCIGSFVTVKLAELTGNTFRATILSS
ncbi:MAG: tRNA (N6-isopentenyl adenosine(37)-C2)-methylthiotransferase MiaB [Treponema sp.]|jgi:tRNA-2-methylthio-N6-dimethylallyladenosine synthase|nr:tRNA (N6-isopentenyl adenosine(37)-C2)-methylthiotransferase MiaB [Treponema sp.]